MNKELIVSATDSEIQLALLEDKQLVELHKDKSGNKVQVGDIYVGKVRKIMPGLNAAFIDVGEEKDGFVHYLDLGTNYNSVAKYMKLAMNGDPSVASLKNFKVEPILEKTRCVRRPPCCVCRSRRSCAWTGNGQSPTSSRKSVPPSAA